MRRIRLTATAVAAAAVAGGLALASPASADPTPAGTFRTLVGVGSDTTQDILNALAGDTVNGTSYADTAVKAGSDGIASYDAIEPGTGAVDSKITTRNGGPSFLRPNGSGKGRTALTDSLAGVPFGTGAAIKNQVDFARSSGGPSASGTALTYIPFARDAVGVAVKGNALQNLTTAQLHDIYSGVLTVVNGQQVRPFIPQGGSGTRKFFLGAIGVPDDAAVDKIATVVQENQADDAVKSDGDLVPFSVASWIAQNNGIAPDHSKKAVAGGAFLASLRLPGNQTFSSPVAVKTDGKLTPATDFYNDATFGRDVYNVVPSRAIDPTSVFFDKSLFDVFVTNGTHEAALATDTAEGVIAKFGFVNEPYNGSINPAKHAKFGGLEDSTLPTALPGTPATKAVTGSGSLNVSWTAPAATGLPVTDYRVVLTDANGLPVQNKDFPATTKSFVFTGLKAAKYTATVTANNLVGGGIPATVTTPVKYASHTAATAAKVAYGTTPKVSVSVTDTHAVTATGKVTVLEGTKVLGTGTLSGGKVSIALSNRLSATTHNLSVAYAGSSTLSASSTTVKLTVAKATPTVVTSHPTTVSHTAHAKLTATVKATGFVPTGKVQIMEGTKVLATGTLANGKAVVTLPTLRTGKHTLHTHYTGTSTTLARNGANFTITSK
ncbi:Ig-like domain repeat protein [Streptomyces sp. NPDC056661]|uniref:Ig-like domain repeat protein n=1 Tax=Streptomyces sp. NPDC056661 TaxID=3345898 RepID=UPI0036C59293